MNFWLLKSEPSAFSIADLERAKSMPTAWDGVRNFEARNNILKMRRGDRALIYHSNASPSALVGLAEIVREAYPDPAQFDPKAPGYDAASSREKPRWSSVDLRFLERFPAPIALETVKKEPGLKGMALVRRGRLSVQPVTAGEWELVLRLAARA